ncbi:MAG TPA: LytTR family DNA-binding domain-containing protein [Balneolaceae bacterium]|nr:LytTR family DNA-binding domain-containing protein [Balneolaceae bacterium]
MRKPAFHRKNVLIWANNGFLAKNDMIKTRTHIFFWIAVTALLTAVFSKVFDSFTLSFYFVSMLLPVAVATSYFFNFFLVPRYLLKKRYARFALYFIYLLIISTWLEMWVITGSFILLADFHYNNLSPIVTNVFILAIILYFIVFLKAFLLLIKRSFTIQKTSKSLRAEKNKFEKGFITVKADRRQAKILFEDIEYVESMGDYVKIITTSGDPVITRQRISLIIKELPSNFLRIHRSFIVNRYKIDFFSKTELQLNETKLPVSRTYKKKTVQQLSKK